MPKIYEDSKRFFKQFAICSAYVFIWVRFDAKRAISATLRHLHISDHQAHAHTSGSFTQRQTFIPRSSAFFVTG